MEEKWTTDNTEGTAVRMLHDWPGKFSLYFSFLKLTSIKNTMYSSKQRLLGHTVNLYIPVYLGNIDGIVGSILTNGSGEK